MRTSMLFAGIGVFVIGVIALTPRPLLAGDDVNVEAANAAKASKRVIVRPPAPPTPAGTTPGKPWAVCQQNADCQDGLFCNGVERCMPGGAGADARGCMASDRACGANGCDEATDQCVNACADADKDGHRDHACGGDDCDDHDGARYPGNVEVCDGSHDEDCDPCTVAEGNRQTADLDGDGELNAFCRNRRASAAPLSCPREIAVGATGTSGTDCDDRNDALGLGAQVCENGKEVSICRRGGAAGAGWEVAPCDGRCAVQPNGTGVCVP